MQMIRNLFKPKKLSIRKLKMNKTDHETVFVEVNKYSDEEIFKEIKRRGLDNDHR